MFTLLPFSKIRRLTSQIWMKSEFIILSQRWSSLQELLPERTHQTYSFSFLFKVPCRVLEGWYWCCFGGWVFVFSFACFIVFSKFGETLGESHEFHCMLSQQQLIFLWRCSLTQYKSTVIYTETWNTPELIRNGYFRHLQIWMLSALARNLWKNIHKSREIQHSDTRSFHKILTKY